MSVIQQRGLAIYKKLDIDIQNIIDYYISIQNKKINKWLNFEIAELFTLTFESNFPYFDEYPAQIGFLKYAEYYEKMQNDEGYITSIVYGNPDIDDWDNWDDNVPMEFVITFVERLKNPLKYPIAWTRESIQELIDYNGTSIYTCRENLITELKSVLEIKNKNKINNILSQFNLKI
jgi:hypothetical protein|tara:strand:- start:1940 stop:2467 length:528 start_codon:yes stop_codon:yes gene_type:complete